MVLDYLSVSRGKLSHSTSVSLLITFFFLYFFLFNVICFTPLCEIFCVISSVTRFILVTLSSGYSAAALDEEYVSTYFLATSKEWFFSGFSYLA